MADIFVYDWEKGSPASFVEAILLYAKNARASDIHIVPYKEKGECLIRVDGLLEYISDIPKKSYKEVISRLKILSHLRIDIHDAPQDGRWRQSCKDNTEIDIRISIVPTHFDEKAVMRVLATSPPNLSLTSLGFSEENQTVLTKAVQKRQGMILVCGPTGSGKTTTLYSLLHLLLKEKISIVTLEDPVEYIVDGITQIPVREKTGLTFSNGLRSIVRQDPDVIMVGEIRDRETASLAVHAALTGHLIISTMHTNDAASAITRLIDMGIDPYLVASTLTVSVGQRLVRKLISESRYEGRVAISEVLLVTKKIRDLMHQKHASHVMADAAISLGMKTMSDHGALLVEKGITTLEELKRVIEYDPAKNKSILYIQEDPL